MAALGTVVPSAGSTFVITKGSGFDAVPQSEPESSSSPSSPHPSVSAPDNAKTAHRTHEPPPVLRMTGIFTHVRRDVNMRAGGDQRGSAAVVATRRSTV